MLPPSPSTRPHWSRPQPGSEAGAMPEAPVDAAIAPESVLAALAGSDQVQATTVYDRDGRRARAAGETDGPPEVCLDDARLDVGAWSNGLALTAQMPELRRQLVGEFDAPNPEAVRDLARLYIRFGFGAEAEALLAAFGDGAGRGPRPSRRPRAGGRGARRHPGRAARARRRLPRQPRPLAGARAPRRRSTTRRASPPSRPPSPPCPRTCACCSAPGFIDRLLDGRSRPARRG